MQPTYWNKAKKTLSANDPKMGEIIAMYKGEGLKRRNDAFITLARSIAGQQISVKAAASVWNKLETNLGSINPAAIISAEEQHLRACGFSRQKVSYLKHIAESFANGSISGEMLYEMDDEQAIKELVKLKGVGRWTAEMFLIFHLQKPDVFPIDDIGLQKAIRKHYCNTFLFSPPASGGRLGGGWPKVGHHPFTTRNTESLKKATNLRNSQTSSENKLWYYLRKKQMAGYKFRRQQSIGKYIVDFVCLEAKLIIELDGSQYTEQKKYDKIRKNYLEKAGYQVLRFWNIDVEKNLDSVLNQIYWFLRSERHPLLNPPPLAGEENNLPPAGGGITSPLQGGAGSFLSQAGEEISDISKQDMLVLAEKWRPYRSVATWYLWRSLDPLPVEY